MPSRIAMSVTVRDMQEAARVPDGRPFKCINMTWTATICGLEIMRRLPAGRETLTLASIDDYIADVLAVADSFKRVPVLNSMGGTIVRRVMRHREVAGADRILAWLRARDI
jgi:hypothetical protein